MKDSDWRKVGAGTGIGFVLLLVLAYILGPNDPPAYPEGAAVTGAYVIEHKNAIDAGAALLAGALLLFAFFLSSISTNSRKKDREGTISYAAHVGGIAALVMAVVGLVLSAASSAAAGNGADATVIAALFQTGSLAFVGASLGVALLVYATGRNVMRFGSLAPYLGIPSVVLGLATAVVAIISLTARDGAFSPYNGELPKILLGLFAVWAIAVAVDLWGRAGKR